MCRVTLTGPRVPTESSRVSWNGPPAHAQGRTMSPVCPCSVPARLHSVCFVDRVRSERAIADLRKPRGTAISPPTFVLALVWIRVFVCRKESNKPSVRTHPRPADVRPRPAGACASKIQTKTRPRHISERTTRRTSRTCRGSQDWQSARGLQRSTTTRGQHGVNFGISSRS